MNRNVVFDAILSMLSAPRDLNESEGLLMPGRDEILQFGVVHVPTPSGRLRNRALKNLGRHLGHLEICILGISLRGRNCSTTLQHLKQ